MEQAPRRRESTPGYKAEGCFCSSQVTITRAPNNSVPPRSEAKWLHLPKPLQAEPWTCQPPKPSALISALPLISSSTFMPHLKPQHFTSCPFPPAPLPSWLFQTLPWCTISAWPLWSQEHTKNIQQKQESALWLLWLLQLSGHGYLARKVQEFPGAASSSQPSLSSTSQLLSFLTTVHAICSNQMGDFKACVIHWLNDSKFLAVTCIINYSAQFQHLSWLRT